MESFNDNIVVIGPHRRSDKYRISLINTNIVDGYITYVFDVYVYETDEDYKVEIGPFNDYYDEKHIRHICNNIPLGLDKKIVYSEMARVCSHIIPFIPSEFCSSLTQTSQTKVLMDEIIKQDNYMDKLTKEELDLRSMCRALEAQRDSLIEASEEKAKSIGGK